MPDLPWTSSTNHSLLLAGCMNPKLGMAWRQCRLSFSAEPCANRPDLPNETAEAPSSAHVHDCQRHMRLPQVLGDSAQLCALSQGRLPAPGGKSASKIME